ncbi:MAG: glutathione S-transferase family protein [Desulfobacterales bacterium]|nr:glutathione S-transferase family protein [Deltaproteobacteria bacterium]NNK93765.1 glutathione S-transferase family protein [Desulfobacterales bacterium]
MYKLYIANKNYSSWSLRPWILMTELQIPFEEKLTPFSENMNWANFRNFSPSGKVPCLQDYDVTVWDSLAITEYLAENHENVWPTNARARAWARCAAAEMHSGFDALRAVCGMNIGLRIKLYEISAALTKDLDRINELWSEGINLFGGPFLGGKEFGAIDAFYAPVVFRILTYNLALNSKANTYYNHMLSLQGMIQWQKMALREAWRDLGHEEEVAQFGKVLADHRLA